jgi:hypothetical protein
MGIGREVGTKERLEGEVPGELTQVSPRPPGVSRRRSLLELI